jgi:hypothetical protein
MATSMFAETLGNFQHSTWLIPENRSFTFLWYLVFAQVSISAKGTLLVMIEVRHVQNCVSEFPKSGSELAYLQACYRSQERFFGLDDPSWVFTALTFDTSTLCLSTLSVTTDFRDVYEARVIRKCDVDFSRAPITCWILNTTAGHILHMQFSKV